MSANPVLVKPIVAPRMSLAAVTRGKRPAPDRILLVGVEGVGKSTFGSEAPSPIFLAAEDGIRQLAVASFPEPRTLEDVYEAVAELQNGAHDYKTLVVDTIDWLEPLVFKGVCRRNEWATIEAPGYGKGYVVAVDEWRLLLSKLDALRLTRNVEVILLAHAIITTFQNPAGADFSRYEMAMHKKSAAVIKQWTDTNLFGTFEEFTSDPKKGKVKGISTGSRVVHTERCAAWDAKNRYSLPPTLPLSYADYADARSAGLQVNEEEIITESLALINKMELGEKAAKYLVGLRGNPAELVRGLNRLRTKASESGVNS